MYRAVHALEHRVDEFAPHLGTHLQSALLAPIVAKIHGVDVVFQGLIYLGNVVVRDGIQELMDKVGMVVKVH